MKTNEELKEARELDADALEEKIASAKNELMNLRFRQVSSQLEHTAQLQTVRKTIARLMTVRTEKRQVETASAS